MADGDRKRLAEEIASARERLVELDRARDAEVKRIAELEAETETLEGESREYALVEPATSDVPATPAARRSPDGKLQIFRSLFRGREDVYPTRFESARTGKQGYGPACENKFAQGLCELPKVKCGECKNQKFFPADDAAYWKHLAGGHVMGVYSMLPDRKRRGGRPQSSKL